MKKWNKEGRKREKRSKETGKKQKREERSNDKKIGQMAPLVFEFSGRGQSVIKAFEFLSLL